MFRNSGSLFAESSISCATSRWSCFCSIVSSFSTNFMDTLCKAKSSVKMESTAPVLIPTSSASSQTVTQQSCVIKVCTWSMSSSFHLVEGLPERASLSTDVQPSLNRLYHFLICVMPMASSPKTFWIFRMVSTWLSPSFWQNLMQYRCSSLSVIFAENNYATHAAYTLSLTCWLYATDTVCWREKNPRMRMKVLSTSLTQHTSRASLVSTEKNHVGYFLNSPHIWYIGNNDKWSYICPFIFVSHYYGDWQCYGYPCQTLFSQQYMTNEFEMLLNKSLCSSVQKDCSWPTGCLPLDKLYSYHSKKIASNVHIPGIPKPMSQTVSGYSPSS